MKVFIKTLKGSTHFEIEVTPNHTVADLKKIIEDVRGSPAFQQMLLYQGKVLEDDTTLKDNNVAENGFIVLMLTKGRSSAGGGSTKSSKPLSNVTQTSGPPFTAEPPASRKLASPVPSSSPAATPSPASLSPTSMVNVASEASNQAAGSKWEEAIQQIIDMGGGAWSRDVVIQALRAAFNNPEQAVEYLYSGIPAQAQIPPVSRTPVNSHAARDQPFQPAAPPAPTAGPNANPLNFFRQGRPNAGSNASGTESLGFLRNSHQFQAMRAMFQANPEVLQPMLQELEKRNPNLMGLIQEHQAEFLRLLNEPFESGERDVIEHIGSAMPQSIQVTPAERDAIERLEGMGFDRALVLEVFFACNKNEVLAANYLLDHIHEFDD